MYSIVYLTIFIIRSTQFPSIKLVIKTTLNFIEVYVFIISYIRQRVSNCVRILQEKSLIKDFEVNVIFRSCNITYFMKQMHFMAQIVSIAALYRPVIIWCIVSYDMLVFPGRTLSVQVANSQSESAAFLALSTLALSSSSLLSFNFSLSSLATFFIQLVEIINRIGYSNIGSISIDYCLCVHILKIFVNLLLYLTLR